MWGFGGSGTSLNAKTEPIDLEKVYIKQAEVLESKILAYEQKVDLSNTNGTPLIIWDTALGPPVITHNQLMKHMVTCSKDKIKLTVENRLKFLSRRASVQFSRIYIILNDLLSTYATILLDTAASLVEKGQHIDWLHIFSNDLHQIITQETEGEIYMDKLLSVAKMSSDHLLVHEQPVLIQKDSGKVFFLNTSEDCKRFGGFPRHETEFFQLPEHHRQYCEQLASSLTQLGLQLEVRLEVWALGQAAKLVGQQMSVSSNPLEKHARCSIILVDRALDLVAPLSVGKTQALDRQALLHQPTVVNMPETRQKDKTQVSKAQRKPLQEYLRVLCRQLQTWMPKDQIESEMSLTTIAKYIQHLETQPQATCLERRVWLMAARTLVDNYETYKSEERLAILLQSTARELQAILDYMQESTAGVEWVLTFYILLNAAQCERQEEDEWDSRRGLIQRLVQALLKLEPDDWQQLSWLKDKERKLLHQSRETQITKEALSALQECIESKLLRAEDAAEPRTLLHELGPQKKYVGLLQILTEKLLAHQELTDLEKVSFSVSGLLKSGFSQLGLSSKKPHPMDRQLIVVYVVGGITYEEIDLMKNALREAKFNETENLPLSFLIASSHIATHSTIQDAYFV